MPGTDSWGGSWGTSWGTSWFYTPTTTPPVDEEVTRGGWYEEEPRKKPKPVDHLKRKRFDDALLADMLATYDRIMGIEITAPEIAAQAHKEISVASGVPTHDVASAGKFKAMATRLQSQSEIVALQRELLMIEQRLLEQQEMDEIAALMLMVI